MDKKICHECGTYNESHYNYCKNCGAQLGVAESGTGYTGQTAGGTYAGAYAYSAPHTADSIDGIPTPDMVRFAGKNSYKIIEKWSVMELTGRKTSWCWPAFLLTFFFGLCGAGFWFLYRRMYKLGAALLAISVVFSIVSTAVTMDAASGLMNSIFSLSQELVETMDENGMYDSQILTDGMNEMMQDSDIAKLTVFSQLSDTVRIALAVLAGLFSLGFYKKYAAGKIKSYGRPLSDMELYLAGGTSGGAAAVGVVFYMIASAVVSVVGMIAMFSVSL